MKKLEIQMEYKKKKRNTKQKTETIKIYIQILKNISEIKGYLKASKYIQQNK